MSINCTVGAITYRNVDNDNTVKENGNKAILESGNNIRWQLEPTGRNQEKQKW